MNISVVIPAYNEESALPGALGALERSIDYLKKKANSNVEVVLVDNLSTDKTAEVAKSFGVKVLSCDIRNISAVLNVGYRASQGDVICRLDADHEVSEKILYEVFQSMKDLNVAGGGFWVKMHSTRAWMRVAADLVQYYFRLRGISLGFVFVSRQTFNEIGGYPEELLVSEDSAFVFKVRDCARKNGFRFLNLNGGVVHTRDRKKDLNFFGHLQLFGSIFLFKKNNKDRSKLKYWYDVDR